jgi:membrane protease YdiL (CAAX protease family)
MTSSGRIEGRERWYLTGTGVIGVSVVLMGVAALENGVAPWSPFYVFYAGLATALPFVWKRAPFGPLRAVRWWQWLLCPVIAVALQAVAGLVLLVAYPAALSALGVTAERAASAAFDYAEMFRAMVAVAGERLGLDADRTRSLYIGFLVLWAGLGEEVFYRGYVQGTLRRRIGAGAAIAVAALLFAVRHYTQMGLLWPDYPWPAATAWVAMGLFVGAALGLLYEKTRSLWMPVAVHYLFNIIPYLAG